MNYIKNCLLITMLMGALYGDSSTMPPCDPDVDTGCYACCVPESEFFPA